MLLAGRIGAWTFIYDDSGFTGHDDTTALSANGRAAATSMYSINADASLTYAIDGTQLAWIDVDDLNVEEDLATMPDELRAAFQAAGTVEHDHLEPGQPDSHVCMRAICALAGLSCTVEDLRRTRYWPHLSADPEPPDHSITSRFTCGPTETEPCSSCAR